MTHAVNHNNDDIDNESAADEYYDANWPTEFHTNTFFSQRSSSTYYSAIAKEAVHCRIYMREAAKRGDDADVENYHYMLQHMLYGMSDGHGDEAFNEVYHCN